MTTGLKKPVLCVGHQVASPAVIFCGRGAGPTTFTMTIPAGTYVMDDVYNGMASASDATDILHRIAYLFDAQFTAGAAAFRPAYNNDYFGTGSNYGGWAAGWKPDAEAVYLDPRAASGTNEEGRRIIRRLGGDGVRVSIFDSFSLLSADGSPVFRIPVQGIWSPNIAEIRLDAEPETGRGTVVVSDAGLAYGFNLGDARKERLIGFSQVEARRIWDRDPSNYANLKRDIWPWLQRGNLFRYYANAGAARTYLTADMNSADDECPVASKTGISVGDWIWVNGEKVKCKGLGTGSSILVFRPEPVDHVKWDPVSNDECATFVLGQDGGNINMQRFPPEPRAFNNDRWNADISAWRSA